MVSTGRRVDAEAGDRVPSGFATYRYLPEGPQLLLCLQLLKPNGVPAIGVKVPLTQFTVMRIRAIALVAGIEKFSRRGQSKKHALCRARKRENPRTG